MIVTHTPAEIGERIRAARKRRKLTQQQAADLVDLPKRTYESYERGELDSPSWEKVRQISEALGVDLETGASRDEPELFDAGPKQSHPGTRGNIGIIFVDVETGADFFGVEFPDYLRVFNPLEVRVRTKSKPDRDNLNLDSG